VCPCTSQTITDDGARVESSTESAPLAPPTSQLMSTNMAKSVIERSGLRLLLTGFGGYDKMRVDTVDCPESPHGNEILMHVRASGINFAELMCRQGLYDRIPKLPAVLGLEASGDVLMVGDDVTQFKVWYGRHGALFVANSKYYL